MNTLGHNNKIKNLSSRALILGTKEFGEFNKLVFLYTEELGKIKAIAKGSRKINSKFTGHLETFNFSKCEFYFGPKNIILTEIKTERHNKELRNNLDKLASVIQLAELTNKLIPENQKVEKLIPLILETLNHLEKTNKELLINFSYTIKFLNMCGLMPDFRELQSNLENKYEKFFEYIKSQNFNNITKINLTKDESIKINEIIYRIINFHTEIKLHQLFPISS